MKDSDAKALSCFKETVEITKAAVSAPLAAGAVWDAGANVANFMQAVYDKLVELADDVDKRSEQ